MRRNLLDMTDLFDFAMIGFLVLIVAIVAIALIDGMNRSAHGDKCALAGDSPACYQQQVEQCVARESLTIQQCLQIVGKSK